jgi:hypothetical protein
VLRALCRTSRRLLCRGLLCQALPQGCAGALADCSGLDDCNSGMPAGAISNIRCNASVASSACMPSPTMNTHQHCCRVKRPVVGRRCRGSVRRLLHHTDPEPPPCNLATKAPLCVSLVAQSHCPAPPRYTCRIVQLRGSPHCNHQHPWYKLCMAGSSVPLNKCACCPNGPAQLPHRHSHP